MKLPTILAKSSRSDSVEENNTEWRLPSRIKTKVCQCTCVRLACVAWMYVIGEVSKQPRVQHRLPLYAATGLASMMLIRLVHKLWLNETRVWLAESGLVNTEAVPLCFSYFRSYWRAA